MHLLELVLGHNIPLAHAVPAHEIDVSPSVTGLNIVAADGLSRTTLLQSSSFLDRSVTSIRRPHYGIVTTLSPRQNGFRSQLLAIGCGWVLLALQVCRVVALRRGPIEVLLVVRGTAEGLSTRHPMFHIRIEAAGCRRSEAHLLTCTRCRVPFLSLLLQCLFDREARHFLDQAFDGAQGRP